MHQSQTVSLSPAKLMQIHASTISILFEFNGFIKNVNKSFFDLRYYTVCNKSVSIVAHLTDKNESGCLTGLHYMYFFCINSTWMAEFRGVYYPGVDQLYCYESDESNPNILHILTRYR